jgi:hypothetical protein
MSKVPHRYLLTLSSFIAIAFTSQSFGERTANGGSGGGNGSVASGATDAPFKTAEQLEQRPITEPFKKHFDQCTRRANMGTGCRFQDKGIMGDKDHQARASCHNVGEAIDIGIIECAGQQIKPDSQHFCDFVKCFADETGGETSTIFARPCGNGNKVKSDHSGHVHIQLKNCRMVAGGGK